VLVTVPLGVLKRTPPSPPAAAASPAVVGQQNGVPGVGMGGGVPVDNGNCIRFVPPLPEVFFCLLLIIIGKKSKKTIKIN
jgi:hypothetical protein